MKTWEFAVVYGDEFGAIRAYKESADTRDGCIDLLYAFLRKMKNITDIQFACMEVDDHEF